MGKRFAGKEALNALLCKFSGANAPKLDTASVVHDLSSDDASKALSASAGKSINEKILKVDSNADGVADNTNLLDGHPESYFVPADDILGVLECKRGEPGGLAPLGNDGKLESQHIPGYADDTVEGWLKSGVFYDDESCEEDFEIEAEKGKIYIDLFSDNSYRWNGEMYVKITSSNMVEMNASIIQDIWDEMSNLKDYDGTTELHGLVNWGTKYEPDLQNWLPDGARVGSIDIDVTDGHWPFKGTPHIEGTKLVIETIECPTDHEGTDAAQCEAIFSIPIMGCAEYKDFTLKFDLKITNT